MLRDVSFNPIVPQATQRQKAKQSNSLGFGVSTGELTEIMMKNDYTILPKITRSGFWGELVKIFKQDNEPVFSCKVSPVLTHRGEGSIPVAVNGNGRTLDEMFKSIADSIPEGAHVEDRETLKKSGKMW